MIPVKLFLINFMCYRDNVLPLYFDNIHLACLCGDNGNGKSALLDAITWALWGKSRANSDDELIHQGEREMQVEFEFEVDGGQYRVLRKRVKKKPESPGQTLLGLEINTGEEFELISSDSIQETQQKILSILRMDYITFINSAYLRQGHADEFTVKAPGERKRVLADILQLSIYDRLEEKAKDYARAKEQQGRVLQNAIEDMQGEIEKKQEYETVLPGLRKTLSELDKEVQNQESRVITLRESKKALDIKQEQLVELQKNTEQAREELVRWQSKFKEHSGKVKEYEKALKQRSEVEKGYARLQKVRKENEELNRKLEASFTLTKRKEKLVQPVSEARGRLLEELGRVQSKAEELEARSESIIILQEELDLVLSKLSNIDQEEEALTRKKKQAGEVSHRVQNLKSTIAQLEQAVRELEDKLSLLMQNEEKCPLCETNLGIEGNQRIQEKYEAEAAAKIDMKLMNEGELRKREGEYLLIEQEINQWEVRIGQERAAAHSQKVSLEKGISLCKEDIIELAKVKEHLVELEEKLAREDFASTEQQGIRKVEQEISDLGYDAEKHKQVKKLLTELEKYEGWQRNLDEAERNLHLEKEALSQVEEAMNRWNSALEDNIDRVKTLTDELNALPELISRLDKDEQSYNSIHQRQTEVKDSMVAIQEKISLCSELERNKQEKEQSLLRALKEKGIYEELAKAFGKKGIQGILIESAIPEIEEETNRLLARMTDNRMHVNIETRQEAEKGEGVETLEIKISDEFGIRNYEMYSGGEAFLIDFALRIALSKLLARRAGVSLPILFIDEGFATQDSNGIDKLVEAIDSIQNEFEKIIVITHLEEFKDAFPVRIEVTKTAGSSTISLS